MGASCNPQTHVHGSAISVLLAIPGIRVLWTYTFEAADSASRVRASNSSHDAPQCGRGGSRLARDRAVHRLGGRVPLRPNEALVCAKSAGTITSGHASAADYCIVQADHESTRLDGMPRRPRDRSTRRSSNCRGVRLLAQAHSLGATSTDRRGAPSKQHSASEVSAPALPPRHDRHADARRACFARERAGI